MSGMVGGTTDVRPANEEVQQVIDSVKQATEEKAGTTFAQYTAVQFKSQVVAGTNFFVKIQVGDNEYIHSRIFRPLPHTNGLPQVKDVQTGKSLDDAIVYF